MDSETTRDFSSKYGLLDDVAKRRYVEKQDWIAKRAKDPYCVSVDMRRESWSDLLPLVEFGDLYHYLITAPSPVTKVPVQMVLCHASAVVMVLLKPRVLLAVVKLH